MKLVNRKRVQLISEGIKIDKDLPKYKNLLKGNEEKQLDTDNLKERKKSEDELKEEIGKEGTKFVRDFIKNYDSSKFNIKISNYLLENLKNSINKAGIGASGIYLNSDFDVDDVDIDQSLYYRMMNSRTILGRIKTIFDYIFSSRKISPERKKEMKKAKEHRINLLQFFSNLKIEASKEREFVDRVEQYVKLIKKAQILHQTAQEEKLIDKLIIHTYESILSISGFNKYVISEDLVNLQSKCDKELEIDYLKNFIRVIPDEVVDKKLKADSLMVFDNYCVIYYDPEGKSYQETNEEERKKIDKIKKDPILFGLIYGSDKLYYIADWIDDLCDLTLDQVVEKIGEVKTLE